MKNNKTVLEKLTELFDILILRKTIKQIIKEKPSEKEGWDYAIWSIIFISFIGIVIRLFFILPKILFRYDLSLVLNALFIAVIIGIISSIIIYSLILIPPLYVSCWWDCLIAKRLGKKVNFSEYFGIALKISAGLWLGVILTRIPDLAIIGWGLIIIYVAYLHKTTLETYFKFSKNQAVFTALIPAILALILLGLFVLLVFQIVMGLVG